MTRKPRLRKACSKCWKAHCVCGLWLPPWAVPVRELPRTKTRWTTPRFVIVTDPPLYEYVSGDHSELVNVTVDADGTRRWYDAMRSSEPTCSWLIKHGALKGHNAQLPVGSPSLDNDGNRLPVEEQPEPAKKSLLKRFPRRVPPCVHHVQEFVFADGSVMRSCRDCRYGVGHTHKDRTWDGKSSHTYNAHLFDHWNYLSRHEGKPLDVIVTTVHSTGFVSPTAGMESKERFIYEFVMKHLKALRSAARDFGTFYPEGFNDGMMSVIHTLTREVTEAELFALSPEDVLSFAKTEIHECAKRDARGDEEPTTLVDCEDAFTPMNLRSGSKRKTRIGPSDEEPVGDGTMEWWTRLMHKSDFEESPVKDTHYDDDGRLAEEHEEFSGGAGRPNILLTNLVENILAQTIDSPAEDTSPYDLELVANALGGGYAGKARAEEWNHLRVRKRDFPQRHEGHVLFTDAEKKKWTRWNKKIAAYNKLAVYLQIDEDWHGEVIRYSVQECPQLDV